MSVPDGSDASLGGATGSGDNLGAVVGKSLRLRSPSGQERDEDVQAVTWHDEDLLVSLVRELPPGQGWQLVLGGMAGADLIGSGIIMSLALNTAFQNGGSSLFCLGFQVLSHLLYSLLLILRLLVDLLPRYEPHGEPCASHVPEEFLLREQRRRDLAREKCFSAAMGFILLGVSVVFLVMACRRFRYWDTWLDNRTDLSDSLAKTTRVLAWCGAALYLPQVLVQIAAARLLKRRFLWNGVFVSLTSLACLLILGLASTYEEEWSWKAEPITTVLLAFLLAIEGVRLLCQHRYDVNARAEEDARL